MKQVEIRTLLSLHFGYPLQANHVSERELLSLISMKLRAAGDSSLSEIRHLSSIYAELKGWRKVPRRVKDRQSDSGDEEVSTPLESTRELMRMVQQYERDKGNEEDEG